MIDAQHLAFLLAQSAMPQAQKEGWLNLLPVMSPTQVERLVTLLEQEQQSYQATAKQLLDDLDRLTDELQSAMQQLQMKERDEIDQFIKQSIHGA